MRIAGKDYDFAPLTVGALKKFIADYEAAHGKSLDDLPIHFLDMEDAASDASGYVSTVDLDAFDGTEDDPDHLDFRCHWALCLYHRVKS